MESFLVQTSHAIRPHDPNGGGDGDVGKAVGKRYAKDVTSLVRGPDAAAMLVNETADLTANGACGAVGIELTLAKITCDLDAGNVRLPPSVSTLTAYADSVSIDTSLRR